ncbi:unnamed protein product [Fusarium graminearum]|nr:unnamed protein product [Fusarium graminearum]CAF3494472.1 unnamed protein product [Fusarium graminearum]CAG2014256.1 unnamed protein product [Fusarium graminearum]
MCENRHILGVGSQGDRSHAGVIYQALGHYTPKTILPITPGDSKDASFQNNVSQQNPGVSKPKGYLLPPMNNGQTRLEK